jgi:hypothetical protein
MSLTLKNIGEGLEKPGIITPKMSVEGAGRILLYVALVLCSNAEGQLSMTNADMAKFIETNRTPLSRLCFAAYTAKFPSVLRIWGIDTTTEDRRASDAAKDFNQGESKNG